MDKLGNYKLGERIGSGAMGSVVKAVAPDGSTVAVKILYPHLANIDEFVKRFNREAGLAQKLSHPNVVKVLDSGCDYGKYYIVMEYVEGRTLLEIMKERGLDSASVKKSVAKAESSLRPVVYDLRAQKTGLETALCAKNVASYAPDGAEEKDFADLSQIRRKSCFTPTETIKIMRQIAGVLQAAEGIGLVHRDIKPQNILIDKKGNAKLLDFGLAKDTEALVSMLSMTGQSIGTPPYMSPEQHEGLRETDIRSDMYSLGATGYHMLAGRPPFPGPTASAYARQHIEEIPESACKLNKEIPLNLSQVIDRLLAKKPEQRHQTPSELIEDLNRVERGEVPLKLHKPKKSKKHNPWILWCSIAASMILCFAIFAAYLSYRSHNSETIVANAVADVRAKLAENHYDDALQQLKSTISQFKADKPALVKEAEALRDTIPEMKKAYLAQKTEDERKLQEDERARKEKERLAELARADQERQQKKTSAESERKSSLAACIRNAERWMEDEDSVRKAASEIEKGYGIAKTDEERKQLNELNQKVKAKLVAVRSWAAVVDFTVDSSVQVKITGSAVAVKMEQALGTNDRLVTRSQVTKALTELKFQASDLTDKSKAKEFGKMAGAEYLITGSIVQVGREVTVAAQCFNIETGAIKQTAEVSTEDVNELNILFREVASILGMGDAEKKSYIDEKFNYPKNFTDGQSSYNKGDYEGAVKALKRALQAKRTTEAENLLKLAEEKNKLQLELQKRKNDFDIAMTEAQKLLREKNWTESEKSFRKALAIEGYSADSSALDGLKAAQGGADYEKKSSAAAMAWADTKAKVQPFLADAKNNLSSDVKRCGAADSALELLSAVSSSSSMSYLSSSEKSEIGNLKSEISSLKSKLSPNPVVGSDWKIPDIGMEFVWIKALNCWAGKYEVANGEYRKFKADHDSKDYKGNSMNGDRQPVVYVNFYDATEYAKWLTDRERKAGRLPSGYTYRLPSEKEWTSFCQCGDNREYPWGNGMPPKYGNYCGQETNGIAGTMISGYNDGFTVSCPVEKSGKNDWGLYGVGGNVWECTVKSSSDLSFDAWRGASWDGYGPGILGSMYRNDNCASVRLNLFGFRLVLSR